MKENFDKALQFVLRWEGGYVNHPKDKGGPTNQGVTQTTYTTYLLQRGNSVKSVASILPDEVKTIYKNMYWDKINGDDLPDGLDIAAFDFAVHSGPGRAMNYLLNHPNAVAKDLLHYRTNYLRSIGQGTQTIFLNGWMNRIKALTEVVCGRS